MSINVDTYKIHTLLVNAGFEKNKADALIEAITASNDEVATKSDIELLKKDLLVMRKELMIQQWIVGTAVVAVLSAINFF